MKRYLTLAEAAEYLGVSTVTVRRWISAGEIPAYRMGPRLVKIRTDDLDAWLVPIPNARTYR